MSLNLDKSTWKRAIFGEVVANINDYFDANRDGVLPYVAGPHINAGDPTVAHYGATDDDKFPPTFKRKFRDRDVLLHSRGIEKLAAVDRAGVTGEKLFVLRSLDERVLLQEYVVWLLLSPEAQAQMKDNFTGSVNKFLNWGPLASLEFNLPPLDEQKRIADLLWTAERHRLTTRNCPEKLSRVFDTWLMERLSALSTVPLREVIAIQNGRPVPSELYGNGTFPLLRPGDMNADGTVSWTSTSVSIPNDFASKYSDWVLEPGDLVINMTAQTLDGRFLGRVCRMHDTALLNQRIGRLTTSDRVSSDYAFLALQSLRFSDWVARRSEGSKVKHMHWRHVADFPFPLASPEIQGAIVSDAANFSRSVSVLAIELERLDKLRSSVLAEIFGGN
ncbi:hypothetical protein CH256_03840 [Rhodococcus sp. 05-2254-6]|uniref:restriction endonuclease subunit S n=1 Tax=Rhodococcus sp. 05-2254-6 TaxID=2022489 RepID=UPI000B9A5973|nr:restriction endonuclease subunit S [Rhodococcus sp. 05-2254-6]OZE42354.1 hypothetical protein CH256_03840 [Rhodococcus sp. 05-2254-6]